MTVVVDEAENLDDFLRLGIVQTTVDAGAAWSASLHMSMMEEERAVAEIQRHLTSLWLEVPKAQIILLPELSVPIGFMPRLRRIATQMNVVIIAGMDFQIAHGSTNKVFNRAAVIIPDGWSRKDRSSNSTVRYVGKTYVAHGEKQNLKKHGYEFQQIPEVWVFEAQRLGRFAVAICFDLLDLERVAMYRLKVQHLFVLAYNKDLPSFNHASEALARMVYCNVVVCNTGTFGGSIAVSPYRGVEKRTIYQHLGSPLSTSQTISLPVRTLVQAQQDKQPANNRQFKSLPPSADGIAVLEKVEESIP
jgi:predicted amidohydrolase